MICLTFGTGGQRYSEVEMADFRNLVRISELKAQFSKILRMVEHGREITITKYGVPVARLIPVEKSREEVARQRG